MNPNQIEQFRRLTAQGMTYGQTPTVKCHKCQQTVNYNTCRHRKVYRNGMIHTLNICLNCQPKKEV